VTVDKPILLAVDDEPAVLGAVTRDLRRHYGESYRVLRAGSGEEALELLRELKRREDAVALLLVDQRMPGVTGVELLRDALLLFPDARRVLLTAYADTDVAIRAINEVRLDHYLLKPWDPPEEHLYPVLDDLLEDWRANFRPPFEGVRVIGHRWSPESHRVKDFLARNLTPYRWLDVETDAEAQQLLASLGGGTAELPLLVFPDGSHLARPDNNAIAERIGLHTSAASDSYDLVIVGAGPAGLAAAVYGASEGLSTLIVEQDAAGGQAGMSSRIENYLGFPSGLSGGDLARRAVSQARRFGTEFLTAQATGLELHGAYRAVTLAGGARVTAQAVLIATGVSYRLLAVPGADRLAGRGVYYGAALTEALECRDRDVFIVGGGNSAGQAAMYLSRFASSVTMLVRGPSLAGTMSHYLIQQIAETPNISVRTGARLLEVRGEESLREVVVGERDGPVVAPAFALFIFIGALPRTDWVADVVQRDTAGYILTGAALASSGKRPAGWQLPRDPFWLETNVPGVFAAGDVRHRSVKRVASAVGEGAMAVQFVHQHLSGPVLAMPPVATVQV
jgi:thioredoxin reductase (NADPH)